MIYDNSNSGVLFRNAKKVPGDKLPDYRGKINVNGVEFELAGWIKDSKKKPGTKFMSLKIQEPKTIKTYEKKNTVKDDNQPEDEVPF